MTLPILDPHALRVLGALLEKQMSTPEYYPLTLNALINACNQSSNRDPVMSLSEADVLASLEALKAEKLAWAVNAAGSRTTKFEHAIRERFDLSEQEAAVLCELILRGPQTPGELRARTARLYPFKDLSEVDAALSCLTETEEALVVALPRQPGAREIRYAHTLAHLEDPRETQPVRVVSSDPRETRPMASLLAGITTPGEVQELRGEVDALRSELRDLRAIIEDLRNALR